jgi:hypothetical protein
VVQEGNQRLRQEDELHMTLWMQKFKQKEIKAG